MDNPSREEALRRLASLSGQERRTLQLVCHGNDYLSITEALFISMSSVKQYMGRVYIKLGLDTLKTRAERMKAIYQIYCPLLHETAESVVADALPAEASSSDESAPEPPLTIPPNIQDMVDEDGYAITRVAPATLKPPPPRPRRRTGIRGLVLGVVLGACLSLVAVVLVLRPDLVSTLPGIGTTPTAAISVSAPEESSLPGVEAPSATSAVVEDVLAATATQPLPTELPTNTALPLLPLPFADDFDSGASSDWQPLISEGAWRVVNGRYTATGVKEFVWSYSLVGDPRWRDYAIDVDYSLENDGVAGVVVVVRAPSRNDLGLAFMILNEYPGWRLFQDGEWQRIVRGDSYVPEQGHIRIEVNGSTFMGSVEGVGQLTITESSEPNGMVGLGVWCRSQSGCPFLDNFEVSPIDQ